MRWDTVLSAETETRKPAADVKELLAEGYRAFVLQHGDRESVTKWAKESLVVSAPLRVAASKELARLDELQRKVGRLESRCYISAKHLEFLKLILGSI